MPIVDFRDAGPPASLIDQAYALVRTVWPGVALADWRQYAGYHLDSHERGLLALVGADAYFSGLCGYERGLDLDRGAVLRVPLFLVFDIMDGTRQTDALLDTLQERRRQLACAQVHIQLRTGQNALSRHLVSRGFLDHGACLRC